MSLSIGRQVSECLEREETHALHASPGRLDEPSPAGQAETLRTLRDRVARIEGAAHRLVSSKDSRCAKSRFPVQPLGIPEADRALAGGFPAAGLSEIHVDETRGSGTGAGFVLGIAALLGADPARPVLWVGSSLTFGEAGMPYLPGLLAFGFDPSGLLLVETRRLEDAIWVAEEASRSRALSMAILEVRGNPARLDLEGTRRLHVRARQAGIPLVLLRQAGRAGPTAAPLRMRIRAGPAAPVSGLDDRPSRLIGHPVFSVTVEKSRGRLHCFLLEWNPHERRFKTFAPPLPGAVPRLAFHRSGPERKDGSVVAFKHLS